MFFTSCFLDIASALRGLIDCTTHWERKFYFKNGYLIIYESLKTHGRHQKEIRELIIKDFKSLEPKYLILSQKLKLFKKEHNYETIITRFRNQAGAHYDKDFANYFEQLKLIDKPASVKALSDFSNFLMLLIEFWCEIIDEFHRRFKM